MATKIQPITRTRHKTLRWKKRTGYSFAGHSSFAVLSAAEVPKAALSLPLALTLRDGRWALGGILGFSPNQNLLVDSLGNWIGAYIPAAFRAYPFCIGWNEADEPVLCVDEGGGLVVEGSDGEDFFDESGELSPTVRQVWNFLTERRAGEVALSDAACALHDAHLAEPWPIISNDQSGPREVTGLYRISEAALMTLPDASLAGLRQRGVLGLAYAQILSMGNLARLGDLAQARAQAEAAERARAEVKPMIVLPEDSTIDWDWSKIGQP